MKYQNRYKGKKERFPWLGLAVGVVLLVLFKFKDQVQPFFAGLVERFKGLVSNEVNKTETIKVKQANDLGMNVPDLSEMEKPIEGLRTNDFFKTISKVVKSEKKQTVTQAQKSRLTPVKVRESIYTAPVQGAAYDRDVLNQDQPIEESRINLAAAPRIAYEPLNSSFSPKYYQLPGA